MENLDLGLLLAKRRALVNEQKKLRENLKALADVVDHDESGKDWKTFPTAQIERNNKLRATCWSWQLRIDDIEREIYVIDEDIRVQMSMQQENDKKSALQEISDRLNYVVPDSKLREYIKFLVVELLFLQDGLLEFMVLEPNLRKVLQDLKSVVTSIPNKSWDFLF